MIMLPQWLTLKSRKDTSVAAIAAIRGASSAVCTSIEGNAAIAARTTNHVHVHLVLEQFLALAVVVSERGREITYPGSLVAFVLASDPVLLCPRVLGHLSAKRMEKELRYRRTELRCIAFWNATKWNGREG